MENKEAFFELLKQQRESQNIEISDICEFTKINSRYIEAIESGDFKILPTVYMRLFLRAYAKFIKADHLKALEDYELFTTGKIVDKSDLNTTSNDNLNTSKDISISNIQEAPQIPPQKIATIAIVSLGLISALYWASKITGEQNIQTGKQESVESITLVQSEPEDSENTARIEAIVSDIKLKDDFDNKSTNPELNQNRKTDPDNLTTSLKPNSYLIKNRADESTTIIQISPPYNISIKAIQKTRLNISKSNNDKSEVLVNGIIDKDEALMFTFESVINFDFINNSHVNVMINDISLNTYLSNNGLAIRGSYRTENSQLYIGFYNPN